MEFNLSLDNLTNRDYYETQNYFESRVTPDAPIVARIHGTPGYPLTAVAGLTFRLAANRPAPCCPETWAAPLYDVQLGWLHVVLFGLWLLVGRAAPLAVAASVRAI